jgi:hypothetical protein
VANDALISFPESSLGQQPEQGIATMSRAGWLGACVETFDGQDITHRRELCERQR